MIVSDEKLDEALETLTSTDDDVAEFKTDLARAEYVLKRTEAHIFLSSEGTVAERSALSKDNDEWEKRYMDVTNAMVKYEKVRAKRETARIIADAWRTAKSASKAGA